MRNRILPMPSVPRPWAISPRRPAAKPLASSLYAAAARPVTDASSHLHLAVRARYGSDLHGLALDVQQRAAEVIDAMVEPEGLDISVTIEDLAVLPAE